MTETSFYWQGTATGDATAAPYSTGRYHTLWQIMFTRGDNEGVVDGYLDSLEVIGITGGVKIKSGGALVDGLFYDNSSSLSVAMDEPVTDPRIDLVVARRDWATQQARIAVIAGTENASPTAPTVTQTEESVWEIPLAEALITTGGIITVTDTRELGVTPLNPAGGLKLIEEVVLTSQSAIISFSDIPQIYRHLYMSGILRCTRISNFFSLLRFRLNEDAGNKYTGSEQHGTNAAPLGSRLTNVANGGLGHVIASQGSVNHMGSLSAWFANYSNSTVFKTVTSDTENFETDAVAKFNRIQYGYLWADTSPITDITILDISGSLFIAGTSVTLYGLA